MKVLSVFLIVCLFFLSASSGWVQAASKTDRHSCCKKMAGAMSCRSDHQKQRGDCGQPGCAMMFSCSLCGFIPVPAVILQRTFACYLPKPVAPVIIGDLSAYHPSSWKPPKAC